MARLIEKLAVANRLSWVLLALLALQGGEAVEPAQRTVDVYVVPAHPAKPGGSIVLGYLRPSGIEAASHLGIGGAHELAWPFRVRFKVPPGEYTAVLTALGPPIQPPVVHVDGRRRSFVVFLRNDLPLQRVGIDLGEPGSHHEADDVFGEIWFEPTMEEYAALPKVFMEWAFDNVPTRTVLKWVLHVPGHRPCYGSEKDFVPDASGALVVRPRLEEGWGRMLRVRRKPSGLPIAGAVVSLDEREVGRTDEFGMLAVEADAAPRELTITASGWEPLKLPAPPANEGLRSGWMLQVELSRSNR